MISSLQWFGLVSTEHKMTTDTLSWLEDEEFNSAVVQVC